MLTLPRILFVRHGETDWNVEGRLQGQTDIPLNALGRYQSEDVARRLTKLLGDPANSRWIVSPLGRTRETAEIARRTLGLEPTAYETEDRLKEITFGIWEGNAGDLRTGLPLQSLHDGTNWVHEPLRLQVFVEATRDRIDAVLEAHPQVRELVENEWISLISMEGDVFHERKRSGWRWLPTA